MYYYGIGIVLSGLCGVCLSLSAQPPTVTSGFPKVIYFRGRSDKQVLKCSAGGIPRPTYRWLKDEVELTSSPSVTISDGELTLIAPTANDAGKYQCYAENPYGKSMSTIVDILEADMEAFTTQPIITKAYTAGEHAVLACRDQPTSSPPGTITWYRENTVLIVPDERITVDQEGSLHFLNVEKTDELPGNKTYNCSLYNDIAQLRVYGSPVKISVATTGSGSILRDPTIAYYSRGEKTIGYVGGSATLQCIPDGRPIPTIVWSRKNGNLPANTPTNKYELTLNNITEEDEGEYVCTAVQGDKQSQQTIFLDVKSEPIWVEKLKSVIVTENSNVQFDCVARSAKGENDNVDIKWFRNGDPLPNGVTGKITVSGPRLTVRDVQKPADLMNIQCKVTNTVGSRLVDASLNVITATVLTVVPEPKLLLNPGEKTEVRVAATADPLYANRLSYRWTKDGALVSTDANDYVYVNAANSLIVDATGLARDPEFLKVLGNYSCKISLGLEGGLGDRVTYTLISSEVEEEIIAEAALNLWWIGLIVAAVVLIVLVVLIVCCLYQNRGGTYPVDVKERRAGHDPEKELGRSFEDLSRADEQYAGQVYENDDPMWNEDHQNVERDNPNDFKQAGIHENYDRQRHDQYNNQSSV